MDARNTTVANAIAAARNASVGGAGSFLAGYAAARIVGAPSAREMAENSAEKAKRDLARTLHFIGSVAQNNGKINGMAAVTAWSAVQTAYDTMRRVF